MKFVFALLVAFVIAGASANWSGASRAKQAKVRTNVARLQKRFATGMDGDEDLGEDGTMKGDKFHFRRKRDSHKHFEMEKEPAYDRDFYEELIL